MILKEAVREVLLEESNYRDPSTNFDVQVKRGGNPKYIQQIVGSFTNEKGNQVECTIGFVNDYTVELSISIDSERMSSSKGMFRSLRAGSEFFSRFLSNILDRMPKHRVDLIYFVQKDRYKGTDIHDDQVRSFVAPVINQMLDDEWTEVGHYSTPKKKSVYLWKRNTGERSDHQGIASSQGPDGQPSWYKSKRPDLSDPIRSREPTSTDHDEFQQQGNKIDQLKSRMRSRESIEFYNQIKAKLYEDLIKYYNA